MSGYRMRKQETLPPISTPSAEPGGDERGSPLLRALLRRRGLLGLIVGWGCGLATVGLGALAVVATGLFDVTAIHPHSNLTAWATHETMIRAERRLSRGVAVPAAFTAAQRSEGFRQYDAECAMCHGGPGVARQGWVDGMTPTPPYITDSARRWSPAELYSIVGEGVKMTGMPAWRAKSSSADIWSLVAFLEILPDLTPQDYARMRAAAAPAGKTRS
jgi:mono/diheme cytochrome c family protein